MVGIRAALAAAVALGAATMVACSPDGGSLLAEEGGSSPEGGPPGGSPFGPEPAACPAGGVDVQALNAAMLAYDESYAEAEALGLGGGTAPAAADPSAANPAAEPDPNPPGTPGVEPVVDPSQSAPGTPGLEPWLSPEQEGLP
jgi:hypothetical protein